jgi:hypothetical protein
MPSNKKSTSTGGEKREQAEAIDALRHVYGLSPDDPDSEILKRALEIALISSIPQHPLLKRLPPVTVH